MYIEPAPATCCACCGNRIDDSRCIACAPLSANGGDVGDPAPSSPASPATGALASTQGLGAGAVILALALFFALKKDRAFF